MRITSALFLAVLVASLTFAAACSSESGDTVVNLPGSTNGITVSGTGRVAAEPDVVILRVGVQTEASTVAAARQSAAVSMQRVVDSLKGNRIEAKDIQTVEFSVQPVYDFTGRVQVLRGYQVRNVVAAQIRRVADAAKVIDDAVEAGGNNVQVQSIQFAVEDRAEAEDKARAAAVAEAKSRASQLAKEAGVSLGEPLAISESAAFAVPQTESLLRAQATGDIATPIESGQLEITITVSVLYGIKQ